MLGSIKDNATKKGSQGVNDDPRKKAGKVFNASSAWELPRVKQQIYNAKSRMSSTVMQDDVEDLFKYARDKENLILHHFDCPKDPWVLKTSSMWSDLPKYTTSDILSYPFCVDPTFKMGQFEVTPIVNKHQLLKSKRTNESPVFLGLTMIHHKKTYAAYRTLASTCAAKCKKITKAKGFITNGEDNLYKAFKDEVKNVRSLCCFKHFETNYKAKLRTTAKKHFERGSSFCSLTQPLLQNEDPIGSRVFAYDKAFEQGSSFCSLTRPFLHNKPRQLRV